MVEVARAETVDSTAPEAHAELKAVILAAGREAITADGRPLVLQTLGERSILQCVVQNALQVVRAGDIYVVVGYRQEDVRSHLGPKFHYAVQEEALGTGHAVLQVTKLLKDFHGNLLILYGDTPLFRPDTIRGLLNRHQLRKAHLTLLTAVVDRPLPYGRIIRDAAGQIIDIIEDIEASPEVREIHAPVSGLRIINSTTRTKCRASTRPRTWSRPSSYCRNASSAPAGRKSRTWWPSEPAVGAPSSARVSPCTTSGA